MLSIARVMNEMMVLILLNSYFFRGYMKQLLFKPLVFFMFKFLDSCEYYW